jgi:hypothetical protein
MWTWRLPEPDPYLGLTDEARVRAAVMARSAERQRRERAAELATWVGTLRDLAEREVAVVVRVVGDHAHRGRLAAIGVDHVAIGLGSGTLALVSLAAVRSVRPEPGRPAPVAMGDRERSQDRTLLEVLDHVLADHGRVAIGLLDLADPLTGVLIGLGEDVLTVRVDGAGRDVVYAPSAAVREVLLDP